MPTLSQQEVETFFAQPGQLMRIASVRPDGSPLVTPIWFIHEEGAIWFTPREKSEWFANLRHDPRVCLDIDEQALPYRKVIIEGEAELVWDIGDDDQWRDRYRRLALRYGPAEMADSYLADTLDQARGLYCVRLDAATVRTWRMPVEGEPGDGIWHQRYYRPGTNLSR
jgi:nitroimidazol reductase NimA-like FMN-containing flavoprotein (pyridoxamine 5'-phosphate oxidase superfamily)